MKMAQFENGFKPRLFINKLTNSISMEKNEELFKSWNNLIDKIISINEEHTIIHTSTNKEIKNDKEQITKNLKSLKTISLNSSPSLYSRKAIKPQRCQIVSRGTTHPEKMHEIIALVYTDD